MRTLIYLITAASLLCPNMARATDDAITFNAFYKLYHGSLVIGESEQKIEKTGNNQYLFESSSRTTGLAKLILDKRIIEQSRWQLVDNQLKPVSYSFKRYEGELDRSESSRFDWDALRVYTTINNRKVELPLHDGMLDQLLYQFAIMRDMQSGIIPTQYTVADSRKLKTYYFDKLGEEKISTPLGDLDTIKLLHYKKDDEKRLVFWCSPEYRYLPVKIEITEDDGRKIEVMIQSVSGMQSS